jgi:hypothetical protein
VLQVALEALDWSSSTAELMHALFVSGFTRPGSLGAHNTAGTHKPQHQHTVTASRASLSCQNASCQCLISVFQDLEQDSFSHLNICQESATRLRRIVLAFDSLL